MTLRVMFVDDYQFHQPQGPLINHLSGISLKLNQLRTLYEYHYDTNEKEHLSLLHTVENKRKKTKHLT